jgi:hypothetical protein
MESIGTSDAIGTSDRRHAGRADREAPQGSVRQDRTRSEPVVCRTCGAFYRAGRWQWLTLPARQATRRTRCPACLRVRGNDPAGFLTLVGGSVPARARELCRVIRRLEEVHRRVDPLSRIVSLRRLPDRIDVTTTDVDLPRGIGEAVARAHGGSLHVVREQDGSVIRVRWLDAVETARRDG